MHRTFGEIWRRVVAEKYV